jgi:hypothetical protein
VNRGLFLSIIAACALAAACDTERAVEKGLASTWVLDSDGYHDELVLGPDGTITWDHSFEGLLLTTGAGTWVATTGLLTINHTYTREPNTGTARYESPYFLDDDRACFLGCYPFTRIGNVLTREIHMTDTRRGPIDLDYRDWYIASEYDLLSGGNCEATETHIFADEPGGTPVDEGSITSHSCIYEQNADGSFVFSIVWEEGDYPDARILVVFGNGWVPDEETANVWTRTD